MVSRAARVGALAICALLMVVGCRPVPLPPQDPAAERTHAVYLVSHGRHAGVALYREDLSVDEWPALDALDAPREPTFVEVGWGDAGFYPADAPTVGDGARALFWPTESVLHLVAVDQSLPEAFPLSTIVRLTVTEAGFERLVEFITRHHADVLEPVARSLYHRGHFFPADRRYHFLYNSNRWSGEALERAGVPIASSIILFEHQLMTQAARWGETISVP